MRKAFLIFLLSFLILDSYASHIVGGEVYYTYLGAGSTPGKSKYRVFLRLFRDCNVQCGGSTNVACLPLTAMIGIFVNEDPYDNTIDLPMPFDHEETISLSTYPACISTRPSVCYEIKTYANTVELADNTAGYVLSYQNCCRAVSQNVLSNASTLNGVPGATYTATIPGTQSLASGYNSSAVFNLKDTSLVCYQSNFTIDFSAVDPDGDSLSYEFAPAYDGGNFISSLDGQAAGPPIYNDVDYNFNNGFSGIQPLGKNVTINSKTGLISGLSPAIAGRYVVNVLVNEWRNGTKISVHQKDFIMRVEQCKVPQAQLKPSYQTCDGFNLTFQNESPLDNITSYYWDFGDPKNAADTSIDPTPEYSFSDSGTYKVTLITNRGQQCSDTASTLAKVYPGFIPDFKVTGSCSINPYTFIDLTTSKYGFVDSWHWNFGDISTTSDTSILRNATYLYPSAQDVDVQLIVTNSKGCTDTIAKQVTISDKPAILLPFSDTLICVKDTLQLHASTVTGTGTFSWSPLSSIDNPNIPDPFVYPVSTTNYIVAVNEKGCINSDTVTVNVVSAVSLNIGADTTICLTDGIRLNPSTNGLKFLWSPSQGVSDVTALNPIITPLSNSQYKLQAFIGGCSATDAINITAVPYPQANAGPDVSICFGKTTLLQASIVATNFAWSPLNSLIKATTLSPVAGPQSTTSYILTVTDDKGCPKPVSDTITVTVIPPVQAFAGHDTTIVINEPLQLNATGGSLYAWSPSTGMNNTQIANPVVTLGPEIDSIIYTVTVSTPEGCSAKDNMKVIVYKSTPDIFIPTAFTPNSDGLNDILRPKPVGMKQFNYFRVFNRWGNMLYSTSQEGQGWDGNFAGEQQAAGTYVFIAQAVDYNGKLVTKKGSFVLIR
ncbi:MAG TPA: PKD domain-containing protein [Panacibacter sp.]|nr:PKD domain-containing protein [Panacibacter sp.]HNP46429.1 PKD domain-containing protein [Panacibacter sp.]